MGIRNVKAWHNMRERDGRTRGKRQKRENSRKEKKQVWANIEAFLVFETGNSCAPLGPISCHLQLVLGVACTRLGYPSPAAYDFSCVPPLFRAPIRIQGRNHVIKAGPMAGRACSMGMWAVIAPSSERPAPRAGFLCMCVLYCALTIALRVLYHPFWACWDRV